MTEHGPESKAKRGQRKRRKLPGPETRPERASNAEVDGRVSVVLSLIVQGVCRRRQILQALAKMFGDGKIDWRVRRPGEPPNLPPPSDPHARQEYLVSVRTVDLYMQRAVSELAKIADEPRAVAKSKARARYELALAGAASGKQWDTVRKVNRDLARLDGLEPGLRVNHTGTVATEHSGTVDHNHNHTVGGTIDERATRINNILGVAAQRRAAAVSTAQTEAANN